jgi:hypothetical protein
MCGPMIFDKDAKTTLWRKGNLFNKQFWGNWITTAKEQSSPFLIPYM